jgi:A/G-specific adenine glycosylase
VNASLRRWYREHGRHDLPWRQTRDPYAVLVSEVMLQQTQVERVVPYYLGWLERWPGVRELAGASPAEVIREWAGLGYNRRAVYLQRAAVSVVETHGGVFPRDIIALRRLPGVGPYTAAAVGSFAFEQAVDVADTNIARVVARSQLGAARPREAGAGAVGHAARELLPVRGARDHNLALMDLGALVCRAREPRCDECPLRRRCAWHASGQPAAPPRGAVPAERFESTGRFARGRIVAALRERGEMDEAELAGLLPDAHRANLARYLAGLAKDGLIVRDGDGWSLPGQSRA